MKYGNHAWKYIQLMYFLEKIHIVLSENLLNVAMLQCSKKLILCPGKYMKI